MKLLDKDKQIFLLIGLFLLIVFFWNSIFIYPIKLFVVMLHEMSHAIMAVIFGGKIHEIEISRYLGGHVIYSIPPSWVAQVVISSSGYLGSMFWGGIIFICATRLNNKYHKYITLLIGLISLILTYFVTLSGELFGIVFCLAFSAVMIYSYRKFDNWFHDFMLKLIGLTSCLYVILDIKGDLIDRSDIGSDADAISQLTFIPSIFVGIFWIVIAIVILYYILKISIGTREKKE